MSIKLRQVKAFFKLHKYLPQPVIHPKWNKPQTSQTAASNRHSLREQLLPLGQWAGKRTACTGECPTKILRLLLNGLIEALSMRKQARNNGGEKKSDVINRRTWQQDGLLKPPPHMLVFGSARYPKAYLFKAAFLKMHLKQLSEISWPYSSQDWDPRCNWSELYYTGIRRKGQHNAQLLYLHLNLLPGAVFSRGVHVLD